MFTAKIDEVQILRNINEALQSPPWKQAMMEEMEALVKNGTWELVSLPQNKNVLGSKWVFTIKYNSDGSIAKHKIKLVNQGFTQTRGIDYDETFAPVAKLNSICVLLSIPANLDWELHQLDKECIPQWRP